MASPLADRTARNRYNKSLRAKGAGAKACSCCHVVRAASQFSPDKRNADGLQSRCKVCDAEYSTRNAEKISVRKRLYNAVNADAQREYRRKRYQANAELFRESTRNYRAANRSRPLDLGDAHLPKRCTTTANGGCGELLTRGDFPRKRETADQRYPLCRDCRSRRDVDRELIRKLRLHAYWDAAGIYDCYLCGCGFSADDEIHIEHIQPRALGGNDDPANLRPAHAECNMAKSDADPYTYLPRVLAEYGVDFHQAMRNMARLNVS